MPPRHTPLAISMSARVVEAFRGEWAPLEDVFSDPGVALDFVRHIDPRCGPTVVRVVATSGDRFDAHEVEGDWLCESGGGPNVTLPSPDKHIGMMLASRGPATDRLLETWETSTRGSPMLQEAATFGVERQSVVLAACACVRLVAALVPAMYGAQHLELLDSLEAWARLRGPRTERTEEAALRAHVKARAAATLYDRILDDYDAPTAAAYVVSAATDVASMVGVSNARAANQAASVMRDVIYAIGGSPRAERVVSGLSEERLADVVREHVRTIDLLRAAAAWAAS